MAGIQLTGLVNGLDTQGIISQLMAVERQPRTADGPLEIHNQDGTLRASVQLKAGATVDDAVGAINSSTDANVYAVNVNGDLVLAAKTTGTTSGFSAVGAGTELEAV